MSTHTFHPDTHEFGLADNCPRCEEHADHPLAGLDDHNLRVLLRRIEEHLPHRSVNEGIAMANLRDVLVQMERLDEVRYGQR